MASRPAYSSTSTPSPQPASSTRVAGGSASSQRADRRELGEIGRVVVPGRVGRPVVVAARGVLAAAHHRRAGAHDVSDSSPSRKPEHTLGLLRIARTTGALCREGAGRPERLPTRPPPAARSAALPGGRMIGWLAADWSGTDCRGMRRRRRRQHARTRRRRHAALTRLHRRLTRELLRRQAAAPWRHDAIRLRRRRLDHVGHDDLRLRPRVVERRRRRAATSRARRLVGMNHDAIVDRGADRPERAARRCSRWPNAGGFERVALRHVDQLERDRRARQLVAR